MLPQINTSLWVQEGDVHEHHGLGHDQAAAMGMLPTMGHGAGDQHLLPMPSGGGGGFGAPLMLPEDNWYFDQGAVGDAAGNGSMVLPPPAMEASGSSSGFGDCSHMFPLLDPGVGGTEPLDVSEFDLDIPGVGSGDFSALLGAGNASNASLLPHGDAEFLRPFGGFGTAPPAQPTDFGGLAGYDLFDTGAGGWSFPSSEGPAAPASLAAPFSGQGNAAVLRPLENLPASGAQPTLYQKRALRRNASEEGDERKRKAAAVASASALSAEPDIMILDDADDDTISIDGSGLNYDSEDGRDVEESAREDGKESNANSTVTDGAAAEGKRKKKKKGMPAKNLMAERRRRKKLNDRLYMLRSVVPRISKMDKASILGDAAEYLKELMQKINDLQIELESSPSTSSLPPTPTSLHPSTPTMAGLPSHVKKELTSPTAQQPHVVVGLREDRAVNIHMLCPRRPGLVHSAMKALEGLGLDVQQAVISYFNEFTLDVFKAECKDGPGPQPEEIKAVLLQSAGFQPAA